MALTTKLKPFKAVIIASEAGTHTVTLSQLQGTSPAAPTKSSISRISWSTTGSIKIKRGSLVVLDLVGSGVMKLDLVHGITLDDGETSDYEIIITTGGAIVMTVSK